MHRPPHNGWVPQLRSDVDQVGTSLVVRLDGELCGLTVPRVRAILLKCLVDQPDSLVVDLAGLTVRDPYTLSVFQVVARQAAMWPGTPIALSVPQPEIRQLLAGYGRPIVFAGLDEALAVKPRQGLPSLSESLLPVRGAPARARSLADEACDRWELSRLSPAARLVTGELATNAMVHAQTMFDVRLTLGRRYLLVAVRDGSTATPHVDFGERRDQATGRGLLLVDAVAERWGSIPADGGKVVWAGLALREREPVPGEERKALN
jgi:anti-anti-sigma regulatory factor